VVACIVLGAIPSYSQIWLSNTDIYNQAEEFLNAEDYEEALPLFLLLEKKEFTSANIMYKIGTCYLNIRGKKDKAISYLELAAHNVSSLNNNTLTETKAPLKALLMLGVAYRINNEPNKAIETFEILKDSIGETNPELLTIVDLHIKRCENSIILSSFPGKAMKEKLPSQINDDFSNYNALLVDHEKVLYYMEELKFYDAIMKAQFENGEWGNPENITPSVGSDGDYYLVGASADGMKLFLYFYDTPKAGEIYTVEKTADGWSKLKQLNDNINTKYHETYASPSVDGSTLFFTSNRPGGFGGLDIYMSKLDQNNNWGPAINVGPAINTPYNEESPFISSNDSILYFSSQGHMNIGGYDVFYSRRMGENDWNQPINMGAPVSTTDDDFFYYPIGNGLSGLMSRLEQPNNTSYDIFRYKNIEFPNTPRYRAKGNTSGITAANYHDYSVVVIDSKTSDTIEVLSPDDHGDYELLLPEGNFEIMITDSKGNKSNSNNLSLENALAETIIMPQQTISMMNRPDNKDKLEKDSIILRNILFRFDNYTIQPEYKTFLDSIQHFMQKYSSLSFLVEGFADALGNDDYNLRLSKKRAQEVANYLVSKNLDSKRLIVVAKGEANPVAINTNPDGSDNPEGRKYNRRVVLIPQENSFNIIFINKSTLPSELMQKAK
jgi:outer membrane protein OmpA-like peptidoglycan-associated protein/tetratricopeptide (TPR) repeat protein